jgi:hypothetical protein
MAISFARVEADVATSPRAELDWLDPIPTWACSIEKCCMVTGKFTPAAAHRLQGNMTRR